MEQPSGGARRVRGPHLTARGRVRHLLRGRRGVQGVRERDAEAEDVGRRADAEGVRGRVSIAHPRRAEHRGQLVPVVRARGGERGEKQAVVRVVHLARALQLDRARGVIERSIDRRARDSGVDVDVIFTIVRARVEASLRRGDAAVDT